MEKYNIDVDKYSNVIDTKNGYLVVNDNDISHNEVLVGQTKDLYLVHSTDFFPNNRMILSNVDGHKRIPFQYQVDDNIFVVKESISPRQTVHFTINGKVQNTSLGEGKWDKPKYIIIEPYDLHEQEFVSGPIHGGDNFTNNSVKLSDKAILVVREDTIDALSKEQKEMYNIVLYKGNPDTCIDNLFTAMGVPKINNYADDRTHSVSKQFQQEEVLEKRAQAIRLIKNMDLSNSYNNYDFTGDEIVLLSKLGTIFNDLSQENTDKLKQALGLDSDYLARFIISNGIVKTGIDSYCLLCPKELLEHLDNPDYYIETVRKSGTGLEELNEKFKTMSIEKYQDISNLELNHQFDNISVGQLQNLQSFNTIKHLRDSLGLSEDKVLLLREDGIYLSTKIEEEVFKGIKIQRYEQKNGTEQLLGSNMDTLQNVQNNYRKITKKDKDDTNSNIIQTKGDKIDMSDNLYSAKKDEAVNPTAEDFVGFASDIIFPKSTTKPDDAEFMEYTEESKRTKDYIDFSESVIDDYMGTVKNGPKENRINEDIKIANSFTPVSEQVKLDDEEAKEYSPNNNLLTELEERRREMRRLQYEKRIKENGINQSKGINLYSLFDDQAKNEAKYQQEKNNDYTNGMTL